MASEYFQKAVDYVLKVEGWGTYTDNPEDSGGPTRWGITQAKAREHGYGGDMQNFPEDQALQIYESDYWDVNKLDAIAARYYPLAEAMFQAGVNCGVRETAGWFQRVLNLMNRENTLYWDLKVDGIIGLVTLQSFDKLSADDQVTAYVSILLFQGKDYIEITEQKPKNEIFYRGWINRIRQTLQQNTTA